jgi:hypothetical protein
MTTSYEPFDGDYIDADYGKLLNDIQTQQGIEIGVFLEICVSFNRGNNKIEVNCSNDEGDEWEYSYAFDIPEGWELEQVREMFPGGVYLKTEDYVKPEQEEEEEDDDGFGDDEYERQLERENPPVECVYCHRVATDGYCDASPDGLCHPADLRD